MITTIYHRDLHAQILNLLRNNAAVVLTGPHQIGKTTLAIAIADSLGAVYRDLENPRELEQAREIGLLVEQYPGRLIILDEVQRAPEIFTQLCGIIDKRRRLGTRTGQFLLLGSASLELLGQSGESLAGRVSYAELSGLNLIEGRPSISEVELWVRGGFPESHIIRHESASMQWRRDLIRTYLEREVPQFGLRIPAETLRRFWTMLAHQQGGLFNAAALAKGLGISGQSAGRYLDIMVDLLLVRRLPPWLSNLGKRLVRSPKVYIRDSGLLHALLELATLDELLSHPVVGNSWEGFIIENLIDENNIHGYRPYFYRTQRGAEIDLLLVRGGVPEIAIEVKRSAYPKAEKGFHIGCEDLQVKHRYLVYPQEESYCLPANVWFTSPAELMLALRNREGMSFKQSPNSS